MKRKAIWAVLTVLLASLGACERAMTPIGPSGSPIPLITTPTSAIPVTFTTTPNLSPTVPVTFAPSVTATIPVTFTATIYPSTTPTLGGGPIPITVTATTTPTAKFTLVKSESATTIAPGLPITYTLSYTQSGGSASNVVLTDTVPTGITFDYSNAAFAGDPGVVFNQNGNLLTWAFSNPADNLTGNISWIGTVGNVPCSAITNIAAMIAPWMSPVLSNGVVCFISCATSTPTVPVTFTATTVPFTPTDSPTIPVTFAPSLTATIPVTFTSTVPPTTPTLTATVPVTFTTSPTSTPVQTPPASACSGATFIGPMIYSFPPVTLVAGYVYYMENGAGLSGTLSTLHPNFFYSGVNATVGLYSDNSGVPGTLLSSSEPFTSIAGWNSVSLNTPVNVTGGNNYWLAIEVSTSCLFNGGNTSSGYLNQAGGSLPSSYSGPSNSDTGWLAFYGDICP
jgi:hypothetical protein